MKTTLTEMELRKTALYIRVQAAQLLEHAEKTGSGSSRNKCRELCDIAEKLDVMRAELVASFSEPANSRHELDRVPDHL